ncbi:hypothetical protein [Paraprevotella clara]|uniref:hypothetical protein n=1 Tax=Paraprevotella clara TaxID=454154 RepID=UPI002675F71D|nr:hypothetical protein [Paraprevotella clara]
MKTNHIFKYWPIAVWVAFAVACTDTWDEHYSGERVASDKTLLQLVEEAGDLGDFLRVLKSTHVFSNNKPTDITYADLLNSDQTFTVWAPKDGTFNVDSLLAECQTVSGDSSCGQHFVQNHIAHYVTNNSEADTKKIIMLNSKYLDVKSGSFHGAPYVSGRSNIPAKNGLLHVLQHEAPYIYNVYEGTTSLPQFSHVGSFFKSYEKLELDENSSIQSGIVDGQIIYSDSVMYRSNILFSTFERINEEDSSYIMLMPDARIWKKVYEEALGHFNYGMANKADSLQRYWANVSLVRDLVYNRNVGCLHMADSVYSTSYNIYDEERHHIYYKPLQPGGIFSSTYVRDSMECSNGVIYELSDWPFTAEQIYFFPVKTEAEIESMLMDYKLCVPSYMSAVSDSVSDGYLDIRQSSSSANWTVDFQVPDVLSGTYDICAVVLPKTVANPNSRDFKPNKFKATLTYETPEGTRESHAFEDDCTNDPYRVDTVLIGRFTIPVCSYGQPNAVVRLQLECNIGRRETQYSREMYLDCLYFKPVKEEE